MPPFKDEHVLIIAPGSQTTQTQLGLPEMFTPPRWRFPTRMFPGPNEGEYEPVKVRSKTVTNVTTIQKDAANGNGTETKPVSVDVEMQDATDNTNGEAKASGDTVPSIPPVTNTDPIPTDAPPLAEPETITTTEETFEDDPLSTEGAVYPMKEGQITNWPCFFALMSHIYKFISPPFHMPVLVIAQPCWTARDKEWITQYFFENWKIPALCVMDSALAAAYAYGVQNATVVDVGLDKCDVSAVSDFVVSDIGRGVALSGCGGSAMTTRLQETLQKAKRYGDVSWETAEQLKRSPICEILAPGVPLPTAGGNEAAASVENPAAAASTGALDSGTGAKDAEGMRPGQAPRGPGEGTGVGEEGGNEEDDNEGVLDVAAIVARDNAAELIAKREKEKAERAAAKKGAADTTKQVRLRNSERERASFIFEEYLPHDTVQNGDAAPQSRKRKREIEIGVERFASASAPEGESDGILDKIAAAVHSTIMGVPDVAARSVLWDNLIVLGNGSRVRGFTNGLLGVLASRYTLSPSTATIFTSELPSNFSTPVPTGGTNTPIPGQPGHSMHTAGHGVNPLLVAATKNMMQPGGIGGPGSQHLQVPGGSQPGGSATPTTSLDPTFSHSYRGFTQTPTSMKTAKMPDYFPEWKDPSVSGMEDAVFLGAQVAAKTFFIVDQGLSKGFLTRAEYNDLGPEGIHACAM